MNDTERVIRTATAIHDGGMDPVMKEFFPKLVQAVIADMDNGWRVPNASKVVYEIEAAMNKVITPEREG